MLSYLAPDNNNWLVLEPNKPIYRNQDGEEFNIVFSEQTIKDLSHNFFKQGYQTNSSIEHGSSIDHITFTESWIVEDPKNDNNKDRVKDYLTSEEYKSLPSVKKKSNGFR